MTTGIDQHTTARLLGGTHPAGGRLSVRATQPSPMPAPSGWSDRCLLRGPPRSRVRAAHRRRACVLFYSQFFARSGLGELFAGLGSARCRSGALLVQGRAPARRRCGRVPPLHDVRPLAAERVSRPEADGAGTAEPRAALGAPGRGPRLRRRRPAHAGFDRVAVVLAPFQRLRSRQRCRRSSCAAARLAFVTRASRCRCAMAPCAWNLATNAMMALTLAWPERRSSWRSPRTLAAPCLAGLRRAALLVSSCRAALAEWMPPADRYYVFPPV